MFFSVKTPPPTQLSVDLHKLRPDRQTDRQTPDKSPSWAPNAEEVKCASRNNYCAKRTLGDQSGLLSGGVCGLSFVKLTLSSGKVTTRFPLGVLNGKHEI